MEENQNYDNYNEIINLLIYLHNCICILHYNIRFTIIFLLGTIMDIY